MTRHILVYDHIYMTHHEFGITNAKYLRLLNGGEGDHLHPHEASSIPRYEHIRTNLPSRWKTYAHICVYGHICCITLYMLRNSMCQEWLWYHRYTSLYQVARGPKIVWPFTIWIRVYMVGATCPYNVMIMSEARTMTSCHQQGWHVCTVQCTLQQYGMLEIVHLSTYQNQSKSWHHMIIIQEWFLYVD